jgi:RNA recognition motif-containing protein
MDDLVIEDDMYDEEEEEKPYEPFYRVRKGGPKEKRLLRVALMNEYDSKPLYFIRITDKGMTQDDSAENFISEEATIDYFSQFGEIGTRYRPTDKETNKPRSFQILGYYDPSLPKTVQDAAKDGISIDGHQIEVSAVQRWFVDLYPASNLSYLDALMDG